MGISSATTRAGANEMTKAYPKSGRGNWVVGVLGVSLLGLSACSSPEHLVKVVIKNDSSVPIQDAHLWLKNGTEDVPPILPGYDVSVTIYPSGESNLEFEFRRGKDDWRHAVFHDYAASGTFALTIRGEGTCWYQLPVSGGEVPFAVLTRRSTTPLVTPKSEMHPPMTQSGDQIEISGQLATINLEHSPAKGPQTASVSVVEFCDFGQVCASYAHIAQKLLEAYPTQVRLVFKHYPMSEGTSIAHEAARAAGEQGKFWEMHDLLFTSRDKFARDDLVAKAKQLNLDLERFTNDLDTHRFRSVVDADREEGRRLPKFPPPALYVNRHIFSGGAGVTDFKPVIDFAIQEATAPYVK